MTATESGRGGARVQASGSPIRRLSRRWWAVVRESIGDIWASAHGKLGLWGVVLLLLLMFASPLIWPLQPFEVDSHAVLQAPSTAHPFGTDQSGRDVLSRVVIGLRMSLSVSLLAVFVGTIVGGTLALVAAQRGGIWDRIMSRVTDVILAFPALIFGLVAAMVLGGGMWSIGAAIAITVMPEIARQARAATLKERKRDYIRAAEGLGMGMWRQLGEILPNAMSPILVTAIMLVPEALILEATLSFLGLGSRPPEPSLGAMVDESRNLALQAPWYAIAPGGVLALAILTVTLIGLAYTDKLSGGAVLARVPSWKKVKNR